ncbi:unnamed protein product [Mucor hiemalis]
MRRTKWQFSLIVLIVSLLFISLVNAAAVVEEEEKEQKHDRVKTISTTTTRRRHHTKPSRKHHKKDDPRPTTTINNCSLAHKKPTNTTKSSHTQTVYVCRLKTTTTKKHHTTKHNQKHHTATKKTSALAKHHSSKKTNSSKKTSHSKKITTTKKHSHSKKSLLPKRIHTLKRPPLLPRNTARARLIPRNLLPLLLRRVTTTVPIVEPLILPTPTANDENTDDSHIPVLPTTPTVVSSAAAVAAAAPTTPIDNNNQVNSQSIDAPGKDDKAQPQSKVIGVSIGAVVGCIAAAGLAGMFIYKRREKNDSQDPEDLNGTSEVNTRWRTQSFMAVVAGAVAKLPKRSNSTASTNGRSSFNVLGSIRRAASNASRSLSVRSARSTRSSVQSYGIAVSGPIPAIARIDGDQAQYFGEPSSPTADNNRNHHTHAYYI